MESIREELYKPEKLREDKEIVIKKLGFIDDQCKESMNLPSRLHLEYPNYESLSRCVRRLAGERRMYSDLNERIVRILSGNVWYGRACRRKN